MKYLILVVCLLCNFSYAGPTQDWNNEFMRLNGIPPSRMANDESMTAYFKTISKSGGYAMPAPVVVAPVVTPVVAPPIAEPTHATAKQLIQTIIDAANALKNIQ